MKKTRNLDYEWIIFFDYFTGEILKCVKGERKNVNVEFDVNEFEGFHVASIHNHPENVYSPPSGKNFGIFARDFEDYELISGSRYFWILKAKGTHEYLVSEMNIVSNTLFNAAFAFCSLRYDDSKIINNMCDIRYGNELIKYINNKNISDIQLTKKEYVAMDINSEHAIYGCREWITDPEAIRLAREYERNPNTLSGKDMVFALYHMLEMDVDYDEIFAD